MNETPLTRFTGDHVWISPVLRSLSRHPSHDTGGKSFPSAKHLMEELSTTVNYRVNKMITCLTQIW